MRDKSSVILFGVPLHLPSGPSIMQSAKITALHCTMSMGKQQVMIRNVWNHHRLKVLSLARIRNVQEKELQKIIGLSCVYLTCGKTCKPDLSD